MSPAMLSHSPARGAAAGGAARLGVSARRRLPVEQPALTLEGADARHVLHGLHDAAVIAAPSRTAK